MFRWPTTSSPFASSLAKAIPGTSTPRWRTSCGACAADKLRFQMEVLTQVIERLGGTTAFSNAGRGNLTEGCRMSTPNFQRSREVLQALVHGIDPENGAELPADTILNRVDIVRALLAATAALDAVRERAMRRAQLPESVGKKWSEEEEQQLKIEFAEGEPVSTIAKKTPTHPPRH